MNRESGRPIGAPGATRLLGAAIGCLAVLAVVTFMVAARLQEGRPAPLAADRNARQPMLTGPSGQATAALVVTASPTPVTPVAGPGRTTTHLQLVNEESGRCLDSGPPSPTNPDGLPYTLPCNGSKYQQWSSIPVKSGSHVMLLKDAQTGLCLTVSPNTQGATKQCDLGDTTLQWTWSGTSADSVYVQVSSGSCLTGDAGQDVMPGECGGAYQHWRQTS